jgi:AsmA protein
MKFLKIFIGLLTGLLILILVIAIWAKYFVDLNDYKPQIVQIVKKTTGRTLTLNGDIHLTIFPWLGIELNQASLSNALGFAEPEFAKLKHAQFSLKVIPLLFKRLEVGTVILDGVELTLTRQADGHTNWEDLLGKQQSTEAKPITLADLKINTLHINQAKIVWNDQLAGTRYTLTDVNANTSAITLKQPITVQLSTAIDVSGVTNATGNVALESQVTIDLANQQYLGEALQLQGTLAGTSVPGGKQTFALKGNVVVDLVKELVAINALELKALDTQLTGQLQARHFQQPFLAGQLQLAKFDLQTALTQFGVPSFPGAKLLHQVALSTTFTTNITQFQLTHVDLQVDENRLQTPELNFDLKEQTLNADNLSLQLFSGKVAGSLNIQQLLSAKIELAGQLTIDSLQPRQVLHQLAQAELISPVSLPEMKLLPLQTAALTSHFQYHPEHGLNLPDLTVQADDKQLITQQFHLNLQQATLAIPTFTLQAFGLNLQGEVDAKQLFSSQPTVNGRLALATFNPREVIPRLEQAQIGLPPIKLPDAKQLPLQTAALQTEFQLQEGQRLTLANLHLQIDDNWFQMQPLQLDLTSQTLENTEFSLQALSMKVKGKIAGHQLFTQPVVHAEITLAPFNPQTVLNRLGQQPLSLPPPFTLTQASLITELELTSSNLALQNFLLLVDNNQFNTPAINYNFAQETVSSAKFMANLLNIKLEGQLLAEKILSQPSWQGSLQTSSFNPRQLLQQLQQPLPLEMADAKALTQLALETELKGNLSQLELTKLQLNLDNSKLQGNVALNNWAKPEVAFQLEVDNLNLDRYLPPKKEKSEQAEKTTPPPAPPTTEPEKDLLPFELLRTLNLNGTLKIGHFQAANLKMNDFQVTVTAQDGQIKLTPIASLYQGSYRGNITLDAQSQPPRLIIDDSLNHLQAEPLLLDLTGEARIAGTTHLSLNLTSDATTLTNLEKSLAGTIRFLFINGTIKGFNIGYSLRKAKAYLKGEPPPKEEKVQTDFASLEGTLIAKAGTLYNNDLEMKSPLLRVNGSGKIILNSQDIDFDLKTGIVTTSKGQGGSGLEELQGLIIPFKVTGKLTEPSVQPELSALSLVLGKATRAAAAKLEEEKRKFLEQNKGKIDKPLQDWLNNLKF